MRKFVASFMFLKPEYFFLVISLAFGIIFLIITPPFQVPDEINHFYRSYQISEGTFVAERFDQRVGGEIPESCVTITKPFLKMRGQMHEKTNFKTIWEQASTPLNERDKIFVDFPNTALYAPVSYAPQAFSIFILRKLNLPPLFIFYGARLFTLLFWVFFIFLSIQIIPIYKWLMVLLALLPMSIYTNMSLSADVITNLLSFLLIALIFKHTLSGKKFEKQDYWLFILLTVLVASAKLVYTPIIILFALIPVNKFKSTRSYFLEFGILLLIGFVTALFWSNYINQLYLTYSDYNPNFRDGIDLIKGADVHKQLNYILSHGLYIFKVFAHSIYRSFSMYYYSYIGTFGWLDTKLPAGVISISYLLIFFIAIVENPKTIKLNLTQRLITLGTFIIIIALVLLSQHLSWDPVGGDRIVTIQGRYLIPALPLLFILLNYSKIHLHTPVIILTIIFTIIILTFSSWKIYSRYYITPRFETLQFTCDAEETFDNKSFKTSNKEILLENADTQNVTRAYSGIHSIMLTPAHPFGFTYRFIGGEIGDIIHVKAWRYGQSGKIVCAGESNKFYVTSDHITQRDTSGWNKIELNYILQTKMKGKEIGIYCYNDKHDTCYFDDLTITIQKLK